MHLCVERFRSHAWYLAAPVCTMLLCALAGNAQAQVAAGDNASSTQVCALSTDTAPSSAAGEPEVNDIDLLQLKVPMVVSATRHEEQVSTLPYAISVITAEDIRLAGAHSVPEALRLVPGMDVASLSCNVDAVSPRGFNGFISRQVLVLVDGRQIFDSLFGGTVWGSWPFQVEDIDHIEVIRGPGGVTWGANAMNGVINIITKDPAQQQGLNSVSTGGSRGSYDQYLGYGLTDKNLRVRVSGGYAASDGFDRGGSIVRPLDDYCKGSRGSVHAIYDATRQDTVTLSAGGSQHDGGDPPMPLAGLFNSRKAYADGEFFLAKWNHKVSLDNQYEVAAYVNDFGGSPGMRSFEYRYQQLALQFSHTFKPSRNHTLSWGMDGRTDLLDTSTADPFMSTKDFMSTAIVGVYLQDEWRFAPKWRLDLGGRMDYEFYGGFQPSARAALSYDISNTSMIYGAVSRAFQMCPLGLRFVDIPVLNGLVHATGQEDLPSQGLVAYELGYRAKPVKNLETDVSVYWNEYNDLDTISPHLGPPGLMQMKETDDAAASSYGLEMANKYKATKNLTLLGNYTFEMLNWRSCAPYHQMDYMTPPTHKFMIGAQYNPWTRLHLSSYLYYVDAVTAPNPINPFGALHFNQYFRWDLRAEYDLWKDRASVAVGVKNLLQPEHYEGTSRFLNSAEVPRMIYAELRMKIQ